MTLSIKSIKVAQKIMNRNFRFQQYKSSPNSKFRSTTNRRETKISSRIFRLSGIMSKEKL
jgi:hypothetical protein